MVGDSRRAPDDCKNDRGEGRANLRYGIAAGVRERGKTGTVAGTWPGDGVRICVNRTARYAAAGSGKVKTRIYEADAGVKSVFCAELCEGVLRVEAQPVLV